MKAIRLRDATCVNPEYNRKVNRQRVNDGLPPLPPVLQCKKGDIVEGDDVHLLCLGKNPALEPYDEECRAAVVRLLNRPGRKADMDRLKRMYDLREQLTPEKKKHVEEMFEKHGPELRGETPAQKAAEPPATPEEPTVKE